MEIATLKTLTPHARNYKSSSCTLLGFNLPSLITTMKQSYAWANGELNALILLKSPEKKIILTAMHAGTEIKSYQANDSVTIEIIQGRLQFHMRKDTVILNKGQVMTLDENSRYSLSTEEETVFLLTILDKPAKNIHN